jgi:hypothetical protein
MKRLNNVFLLIIIFIANNISSKVLIFTYSYNRPDFIEIQYKTFKKFLLDDYEFVVFNDATDSSLFTQIDDTCKKYNIKCVPIPQQIHDPVYDPSIRNCRVVQYSLDVMGFAHDDIVALIDSDMFLISKFSIREYLAGFALAGWPQQRNNINYLWIGLVFLDMRTMPNKKSINFGCGLIDGQRVDSGGYTYYYLHENPEAKVRYLENVFYVKNFFCSYCLENNQDICDHKINAMNKLKFSEPLIQLVTHGKNSTMEVYLNNTFLHYRAGSNWNCESVEYHQHKTNMLNRFVESLVE